MRIVRQSGMRISSSCVVLVSSCCCLMMFELQFESQCNDRMEKLRGEFLDLRIWKRLERDVSDCCFEMDRFFLNVCNYNMNNNLVDYLIKKRKKKKWWIYSLGKNDNFFIGGRITFFKWFILFYNLIQFCSNVYFMFDGWCLIFRFCRFENFIILEIICWVYIAFRGAHRSTLNFPYFMWHGILWKNSNF